MSSVLDALQCVANVVVQRRNCLNVIVDLASPMLNSLDFDEGDDPENDADYHREEFT